ncbi:MAG: hypothetical protein RL748_1503 [Pseudomonadota bacterium]|jgi:AcrR family transcriptional regulator
MPARGRPREFDRDQALEVAMRIFLHHGYDGTSVSYLGEKMGINTPSLYAAFGSKDMLYQEAVGLYITRVTTPLIDALNAAASAREGIATFLESCARYFHAQPDGERGCMIFNGDLVYAPSCHQRAKDMVARRKTVEQAFASRLSRAQQEHELPAAANPTQLAAFYCVVLQGLSIRARDGAELDDLLQVVTHAMLAWPQA